MTKRDNQTDTTLFQSWQRRAEDDVLAMEAMLKEGGPANPVCFHAQQAVEKYLKGFLSMRNQDVPRIHSVVALLDKCIALDVTFEQLKEDVAYLETFYVSVRYPGDYPEFSLKEAQEAYQAAIRVKEHIGKNLFL